MMMTTVSEDIMAGNAKTVNELMNTRLIKRYVYEREHIFGLAARCDWFVNNEQLIRLVETDNPKTVFVSAWLGNISIPYFANAVLPQINKKFNLIIASEDVTFPYGIGDVRQHYYRNCQNEVKKIFENEFVHMIYVENLDCNDPKCFPIPLGILQYNHLYSDYLQLFVQKSLPSKQESRPFNVFCCHRINDGTTIRNGPQWEKRRRVSRLAQNEWKSFVFYKEPNDDENEFFTTLQQSKFCLCVQGGGYDPSPRCWQAILCGSIPIVEHSPLDRAYERLPIAFVDSWSDDAISEEKLADFYTKLSPYYVDARKRANVLQMLSLNYWINLIENNVFDYDCIASVTESARRAKEKHVIFTYGSTQQRQDVSRAAILSFLSGNIVKIHRDVYFNCLFGDVHPNVTKTLEIQFSDSRPSICLGERRNEDVEFAFKLEISS